jgi:hypothetical protein
MYDPEFEAEPIDKRLDTRSRPGRRRFLIACVALLGACWLGLGSRSVRRFTCAVCREGKVESRFLGLSWASQAETDCSRWYRDNVEPTHPHAWAAHASCQRIGIPGLSSGFACSMGSPIAGLSERVQVHIYEHFQDRLEAKRLFLSVARRDDMSGHRWEVLMAWVNANYPGNWQDWWEKHRDASEE